MASLWLGVVFWPMALRVAIACWNSRSVSRVSRTNACRCLTSEARSSFVRASGVRCISASTAAVTSSSLRMIMRLSSGGGRKSSLAPVVAGRGGLAASAVLLKPLLLLREATRGRHVTRLCHGLRLNDRPALGFGHPHMRGYHDVMAVVPMRPRMEVMMRNEHRSRRPRPPVDRTVVRPPPRAVHDVRIVVAHVNVLGAGLNDDRARVLVDRLLFVASEIAGGLRALAQ